MQNQESNSQAMENSCGGYFMSSEQKNYQQCVIQYETGSVSKVKEIARYRIREHVAIEMPETQECYKRTER